MQKNTYMQSMLVLLLLLFGGFSAAAQNRLLSGTVTSTEKEELPGVSIVVKGTTNGTATDADGKFSLNLPDESIIVVSYMGFVTKEVNVGKLNTLHIQLQEDISALDEVVVVGYGTQKKSLVTGSISSVKAEELKSISSGNVNQALQGRTAGVNVVPQGGQPGAPATIRIRGAGSNGKSDPLYIVDGMRASGIEYLDPSEIASMEILKDAASAAIYGAEGANGVILVTTKSGKAGSPEINYSNQFGVQSVGKYMKMMNAPQFYQYYLEAGVDQEKRPTMAETAAAGDGTDWMGALFQTAPQQKHSLSFSGGSDKTTYMVGASYNDQQGIAGGEKSRFQRYTVRVNTDTKVKPWLNIGERISYSNFKTRGISDNSENASVLHGAIAMDPFTPVYYEPGSPLPQYVQSVLNGEFGSRLVRDEQGRLFGISKYTVNEDANPLAKIYNTNSGKQNDKIVGNMYADIEPIKGLKFTTRFGLDASFEREHGWTPLFYYTGAADNKLTYADDRRTTRLSWQWENFATYSKTLGDHSLSGLAGVSALRKRYDGIATQVKDFVYPDISNSYPDFAPNDFDNVSGKVTTSTLQSYFGRLGYEYKNRYLLNASLRADGSSLLAEGNKWGYFPAVSAGWILSAEPFFPEKLASVAEYVKLRGSWGQNGSLANLDVGNWRRNYTTMGNYYYDANGNFLAGAAPGAIENADLTWETSEQLTFGADMTFLNNRISLGIDWFNKKTKDLLTRPSLPGTAGNIMKYINGGDVQNTGWEFELTYRSDKTNAFTYEIATNFSTIKNKVTYLNPTVSKLAGAGVARGYTATYFEEGLPIWYFSGYKTDGIIQNQAQADAYNAKYGIKGEGIFKPGDPVVQDVNGDGSITSEDQTFIGDPTPKFTYGLRLSSAYKGFDFTAFLQGQYGNKILMGFNRYDLGEGNRPAFFYDDRWTGEGSTNSWFASDVSSAYAYQSDLMVFDGSFARIRQLQLGYTFKNELLKKVQAKNVRIYASLDNFFTFTKYPGMDPEGGANVDVSVDPNNAKGIGIDRGGYPVPRTFTAGLSFTF